MHIELIHRLIILPPPKTVFGGDSGVVALH